jgi:hypothetical protein
MTNSIVTKIKEAITASNALAEDLCPEVQCLRRLLTFLEKKIEPVKQKMIQLKDNITFDLLWYLFPVGSEIMFKDENSGLVCAGKVRSFVLAPF